MDCSIRIIYLKHGLSVRTAPLPPNLVPVALKMLRSAKIIGFEAYDTPEGIPNEINSDRRHPEKDF